MQLNLQTDGSLPHEVQLIPYGNIKGRDGRCFVMTDIDAVISNTIQKFNPSQSSNRLDLVIDYEHQTRFSEQNGAPAPAAAWIKRLVNKGRDGLWGEIEWTPRAAEAVRNKEYRYLSPVFTHQQGQIKTLLNAGLTNVPNLEVKSFNKSNSNFYEENQNVNLTKLCQLLGLAETSTLEDIIAKVTELQQSQTAAIPAMNKISGALGITDIDVDAIVTAINKQKSSTVEVDKYVALNKEMSELRQLYSKDKMETAINRDIEKGTLMPALREPAASIFEHQGEKAYNDFVAKLPKIELNKSISPSGTPPSSDNGLTDGQVELCRQMGVSAEDFKKYNQENK